MIDNYLDEDNFIVYAAKHYDNPHCFDDVEFFEDLQKFKYLKKLLKKYDQTGDFRDRLILNHVITITNLFGTKHSPRMLFLKMPEYKKQLKTILTYLYIMPDVIEYGETKIYSSDIPLDLNIMKVLRSI